MTDCVTIVDDSVMGCNATRRHCHRVVWAPIDRARRVGLMRNCPLALVADERGHTPEIADIPTGGNVGVLIRFLDDCRQRHIGVGTGRIVAFAQRRLDAAYLAVVQLNLAFGSYQPVVICIVMRRDAELAVGVVGFGPVFVGYGQLNQQVAMGAQV